VRVPKIGNYCNLTVFLNSSLIQGFYFLDDITLGLCMLLFGRLLYFCDSTYWPLVIDVYTRYLIDDNFIKTCFFYLI